MSVLVIQQQNDGNKILSIINSEDTLVESRPCSSWSECSAIVYDHLMLILPGEQVRLVSLKTPTSLSTSDLQQAIPNMLEESLAEDIQSLHFSIGAPNDRQERPIAVIKKTLWAQLMAELAEHHIRPDLLVPDYLALPYHEGTWSLYYDDHTVMVRTGLAEGFSTHPELITTLLPLRFQC